MADLVIGGKTYKGIHTVKFNATDNSEVSFHEGGSVSPTVTSIDYSTLDQGHFTVTLDDGTVIQCNASITDGRVATIEVGDKSVTVDWGV